MHVVGVCIDELPTLGEATLAKELALDIASDAIVATLFKFLFYHNVLLSSLSVS